MVGVMVGLSCMRLIGFRQARRYEHVHGLTRVIEEITSQRLSAKGEMRMLICVSRYA